ncbi:MAG: hypothetical protein CSYNP_04376 [Syntrophus sp. SKADARSKE-3]|nr:hypothetical protein [Syntrophus sp. SKADARSKE-3]
MMANIDRREIPVFPYTINCLILRTLHWVAPHWMNVGVAPKTGKLTQGPSVLFEKICNHNWLIKLTGVQIMKVSKQSYVTLDD